MLCVSSEVDCLNCYCYFGIVVQNWKDAVRNSIQLSYRGNTSAPPTSQQQGGRRNLMSAILENSHGSSQPTLDTEMDLNMHESNNKSSE